MLQLFSDNTMSCLKNCQNKKCETPLMITSGAGFTNVIQLLLDFKADINLEHRKSDNALYLLHGVNTRNSVLRIKTISSITLLSF